MPWKLDENGSFVTTETGNPVWLDESGQDREADYTAWSKRLGETTKESVSRKEKIRELEKAMEPFKDLENPAEWMAEAKKALEMMKNAPDAQKAVEEQIRARVESATRPLQEKLALADKGISELKTRLERETITNTVNNLPFLAQLDTPTTVKALFLSRVGMDDDGLFVKDDNGQILYGENGRMGLNDGLIAFVNSHPDGAKWKTGNKGSGSGASNDGGAGHSGTPKTLKDCKTDAERVAYLRAKTAVM